MPHPHRLPALLLACLLALSLPAASSAGSSGDIHITETADYDGVWVAIPEQGYRLYLPRGWTLTASTTDEGILFQSPDGAWRITLSTFPGERYTVEGLLEAFAATEGFTDVQLLYFNDVPFIHYGLPAQDQFGLVTLSADYTTTYFFLFSPYNDPTFSRLALKIMSTLSPAV